MPDLCYPRRSLQIFLLQLTVCSSVLAQVNVTTYHNDNARTGQNTQETTLTTANVNTSTFGKLFSVSVDGQVYAQPLILSGVNINGTHNVVYVATENDSVYAIDANNGTVYWHKSLILNGGTPIPKGFNSGLWNNNVDPKYGITGTPVIDPTTNTIYAVASTDESGVAYHRLHALDVTSGAEKFGGPIVISGSYGGQTFNANVQFNRPALLLQSGHVIIAFGQPCDKCEFGWVFSYNAGTLAREGVFCTNPGNADGTIWMSGDGVAADSSGNLYFATGNGDYDGVDEYGDSIIKLGLPSGGAFPFLDWFTPNIQQVEHDCDWDQGSGGVLILPDLGSGSHPHLLVQVGKTGTMYLIDRTTGNMGKWCGTVDGGSNSCTDLAVQEILGSSSAIGGSSANLVGVWGSPAYWNGNVYFPSANKEPGNGTCLGLGNGSGNTPDYVKAYSFNAGGSGVLSTQPTSHTPQQFNWPGPNPTVSSNGTTNGILWAIDSSSYILHAYNASNLSSELYNSNSVPWRDGLGGAIKFSVPTIANGKVYVGGNGQLAVLGLMPASLSPASQNFGTWYQSDSPKTKTLTFSNTGTSTITITSIGADLSPPFSKTGTTCGSTLGAGASCSINVTFTPADANIGVNTEILHVVDSAVNSPQPAQLTGTMKCPAGGCL